MDLGLGEILLILVVALLVFGPKKLPELGKALGRAMHEFKKAANEFKNNLDAEVGASQIKEELLKQQKEIQSNIAAAPGSAVTTEADYANPPEDKAGSGPDALSPSVPAEENKPQAVEVPKSYAG